MSEGVRTRAEAEATEECCLQGGSRGLLSLLSYTTWTTCPGLIPLTVSAYSDME